MSGQQDLAWETQDGVRSLQAALNSQPPVPMPLASWDTNTNSIPKLEGLDTIDLSTAPSSPTTGSTWTSCDQDDQDFDKKILNQDCCLALSGQERNQELHCMQ